ncbi:hypothetical protein DFH05DRAFT_1524482 [Lentinula detonsa]|uniref:Uncharacterized protein n=1 Tax=Lentinula detonsa TaxID=2804962 RepID=A0A9W8TXX5_9AGAR|nr:hypothetical protein DFH05DRAFT_1524482 [Lentinula detonsa]KAJ3986107.1 hypothetical protein F5890DRAFT_1552523 [Lentinula detonsa]
MQLRLSFVLLGIATAALSRPIVVSQTIPTALSSSSGTSAPASTLTSTHNPLSTPTPTLLSDFDARQISDPYLEDRSLDLDIREIPSNSASSLESRALFTTRAVKDPSSEIAESYANTHTSMDTRAEIHGSIASDGYLSKREFFEQLGKGAGKVAHDPAVQQFRGAFQTLGSEAKSTAQKTGQHMKTGYNEGAGGGAPPQSGGGAPPQSPQLSNPDVETRGLVEEAQKVVDTESQIKNGANKVSHFFTDPVHAATSQMKDGLHNVGDSAKEKATAAASSVENAGAGALRGAQGALNGAEQGYKEGANGGAAPAT